MRRALLLLLLLALAGCGGDESPNEVLAETAGKLPEIHSGDMTVDLAASGRGGGTSAALGFRLDGPFALPEKGRLPVAQLSYTQRSGDRQASATFISTGEKAFVLAGGQTQALPAPQAERLRAAAGTISRGGGVRELRLDRWMRDPTLSDGPNVGGDATDRVSAAVDVGAALKDLAGSLGDTRQLERAVRDARVEVLTGSDDRLLRRLTLHARLALDVPDGLREQLGQLVGGKVRFVFEIREPNREVSVRAPAVSG